MGEGTIWKGALFNQLPLKTEKEVKEYKEDLGVSYYNLKVEVTIDVFNTYKDKLNKVHRLYEDIIKAKENEETHSKFTI